MQITENGRRKKLVSKDNKWNRLSIGWAMFNSTANPQTYLAFCIRAPLAHTHTHILMNIARISYAQYFVLYQPKALPIFFPGVSLQCCCLFWGIVVLWEFHGHFPTKKLNVSSVEKMVEARDRKRHPFNSNILSLSNHLFIFAIFVLCTKKHKLRLSLTVTWKQNCR